MTNCNHTTSKKLGYIDDYHDAEKRQKKGEKQIQCPVCKLWIRESEYLTKDA